MSDLTAQGSVKPKPAARKGAASPAERWRRAADVSARTVAAIALGYVTASLATAVLARLLPGPVEEATIAATTFSFVIYVSVVIWAFADRHAWRVWAGLITACAVLTGALLWSLSVEPRL